MADLNKVVAGIRCIEVLELLSDYLDGDVSQEVKERIEAHLRGCDQCERFGGQVSSIVKSLREQLTVGSSGSSDAGGRFPDSR